MERTSKLTVELPAMTLVLPGYAAIAPAVATDTVPSRESDCAQRVTKSLSGFAKRADRSERRDRSLGTIERTTINNRIEVASGGNNHEMWICSWKLR